MKRKTLLLTFVVGLLLVALAASAPTTLAQGPTGKGNVAPRLVAPGVPADGPFATSRPTGGNLQDDLAAVEAQIAKSPIKPPAIDTNNPPETVQKAVTLQKSLTAEQQAQVRAALDKYLPEMKEIGNAVLASGKPTTSGAKTGVSRQIATRLSALTTNVDAEMAKILTANQYALYQAAVRPNVKADRSVGIAGSTQSAADVGTIQTSNVSTTSSSSCFYAGYYGEVADYYSYYGYLYGYYNYYYYGDTYAYYGYIYAYYGWYYALVAEPLLGGAYFEAYILGSDWHSWGYYGYIYSIYSYYYNYYGYIYSYYSYYYYGHTYAYYAYLYSYYGQYFAYYAYVYGYYYCT